MASARPQAIETFVVAGPAGQDPVSHGLVVDRVAV